LFSSGARAVLLLRRDLTAQALEYAALGSDYFEGGQSAQSIAAAAMGTTSGGRTTAGGTMRMSSSSSATHLPVAGLVAGAVAVRVEDGRLSAAVEELCGGRSRMAFRDYDALLTAEDASSALRKAFPYTGHPRQQSRGRGGGAAVSEESTSPWEAREEDVPASHAVAMPDGRVLDYPRAAAAFARDAHAAAEASPASSAPGASTTHAAARTAPYSYSRPLALDFRLDASGQRRLDAFQELACGVLGTIEDREGVGVRGTIYG
jgi:hypothetical protein